MIIDKTVKKLLQERQELFNQVLPFETVLLENDEGLIAGENELVNQQWYSELDMVIDPQQAAEMAPQQAEMAPQQAQAAAEQQAQAAAEQQAEFDLDELAAIQITQTQEIFTKMYLVKRIEKLKRFIRNLINLMEMKFDIDEFDKLKRFSIYIDTLDEIALILSAETLFHIIVDFEFELLELIDKIDKTAAETIKEFYKSEEDNI